MSANNRTGNAGENITPLRALPARPNLEFERKAAKKLLRALNAGDASALRRARALSATRPNETAFILANAQFIIAREYGFISWRLLVSYFEGLRRQTESGLHTRRIVPREIDQEVNSLLSYHRRGGAEAGLPLASWVPRFYGRSVAAVLATPITIDDARLAIARFYHAPSWEVLVESNAAPDPGSPERVDNQAATAIRSGDIRKLQTLLDAHPELCAQPRGPNGIFSLLRSALHWERTNATDGARAIVELLTERGADWQFALNSMLLVGRLERSSASDVEYWLARGADPEWIAPNGIPILEYLINGTFHRGSPLAVDALAKHVTPRKALWISAGLGDVRGVRRYFDREGNLKPSAKVNRPDFTAMSPIALPFLPEADDISIVWEAFYVAGLNERIHVLDALLSFGFPVDHNEWGIPLLMMSVWNHKPDLVEFLISRGANPETRWVTAGASARDMAEEFFAQHPTDDDWLRILRACGGREP